MAADNAVTSTKLGLIHLDMEGNKGLAAAYNKAINRIRNLCKWIVVFDDDTSVPADYCRRLDEEAAKDPEAYIFLPLVADEKGLLSPCRSAGYRFKRISAEEVRHLSQNRPDHLSAINTGMAIKADLFINYHYDTRLFLDCIDHLFLYQMRQTGTVIRVFDVLLHQQFADTRASCAEKLARFRIYAGDYAYYCRITRQNKVACRIMLLGRAGKLAWRCRNSAFFRVLRPGTVK
jgi:GT2 family glycosyltransferase